MADRVFPSSKPTTNGAAPPPPPAAAAKPAVRPPYRPQPYNRRRRRSRRNYCCCCCFWIILILLALAAAIAVAAIYMLYSPHRPAFSIPSFRIHRLNLTSSSDHLTALFNLTVTSKNPNSHLTFLYDPFVVSSFSANGGVFLGNGTLPGFTSAEQNQTAFKYVAVSASSDLDTDSVTSLKSDLKKKSGVPLKIQMDSKVKIKAGKFSVKVGIRVTCEGFKGEVPKGKSPSLVTTDNSKCKVDLPIKIWKFTS